MKLKTCLVAVFGIAMLAVAAPHTWTLKNGSSVQGDYFSSGTTILVLKRSGTNYFLNISDLATNDLPYLAKMQSAQRQSQLDAQTRQMQQSGMIELTKQLIDNFPEKVVDQKRAWMDATFYDFNPGGDPLNHDNDLTALELVLQVWDKNNDTVSCCVVQKYLYPNNIVNIYADKRPNPLAAVAANLKRGDKIRLIGSIEAPTTSYDHTLLYFRFSIDQIEMIESAAERKAREGPAANLSEPTK